MFSMTGYFLRRVEGRRPVDHAPDIGLAVTALRDKHLGRFPAGLFQRSDVDGFDLTDERCVCAASQLRHCRQVDSRVRVDVVGAVGRKRDSVVGVGGGERRQPRPVEVNAIVVNEIRILARRHAARAEPDLPLFLVNRDDAADDPIALGNLPLHCASRTVVQIQVVPPVALRHPDDFLSVVDVESILLA